MNQKLLYPFVDSEEVARPRQRNNDPVKPTQGQGRDREGSAPQISYFELARVMERASRRFSGLLRAELTKLGADDIGASQAMVLLAIGDKELSVGELLDRGHYVGSNISYYLKQLADGGYIDRVASQRDKRSARIRLTGKGAQLCADLRQAARSYERVLAQGDADWRDLEIAFHTLHRLEVIWGNAARYGL